MLNHDFVSWSGCLDAFCSSSSRMREPVKVPHLFGAVVKNKKFSRLPVRQMRHNGCASSWELGNYNTPLIIMQASAGPALTLVHKIPSFIAIFMVLCGQ